MLKIGTTVTYPGGKGTIDKTSTRTGQKLYRVADKWFTKDALSVE